MIAAGLRGTHREKIVKLGACQINSEAYAKKEKERMDKERQDALRFITIVHKYFMANICINTRLRSTLLKRQIAHFLANEFNFAAKATISDVIGGQDHATVYNSIKAVNRLIDTNFSIYYAFYVKGRKFTEINTITRTFNESDSFISLIDDLRDYLNKCGFTKKPIV